MPALSGSPLRGNRSAPQLVDHDTAVKALPRRPLLWPPQALTVAGAGAVLDGVGLVGENSVLVLWASIAVILCIATVITFGIRAHARGVSIDKMIEAVNPILQGGGALPTRDLVRATRWQDGWIGLPGRMDMRYAAAVFDMTPSFTHDLLEQVSNRLGRPYKVKKNNSRRCIITLIIDNDPDASAIDEDKRNLESILAPAIPGVTISGASRTETGELRTAAFTWPASATSRVMKRVWQRQAIESVQAAFDNPSLTITFDLASREGVIAPVTPLPDVLPHPPRNPDAPMQVAFGQFRNGAPCIWDLDAPLPHVLIVGGTGGGKTVLLLSILTGLPEAAEIWPLDPKRLGLFNLDLLPGAKKAATRPAAMVKYILSVKQLMDDRYEYLEKNGPQLRAELHPIVLTVDEGEEMADLLNEWWQSGEGKQDWCMRMGLDKAPSGNKHPVMTAFGSILRLGREARVHVILASQQAASTWLSTSSRSQFAVRIALRNLEQSTSLMTFGSLAATSGLENKPGRAWVAVGMGAAPEHAQIYWTPKLAPGLGDTDRAILHGLGVTLPDDEGFIAPEGDEASPEMGDPVEDSEPAITEAGTAAAPPAQPNAADESSDAGLIEVSVSELEPGMQILVDIDGHSARATVDEVDPDLNDPDYLVITYTTTDGEVGSVSAPDSDQVSVCIPEE